MDFCSSFLGCKISSDKPSLDGFEVSNLIDKNERGFVCESFVRTPMSIIIDFPVPVEIAFIKLETKVRERKSNGFKIYSQRKLRTETPFNTTLYKEIYNRNFRPRPLSCITQTNKCIESDHDQFCLGKWLSFSETSVVLKNFSYKHFLSFPLPFEFISNSYIGALRNPNQLSMKCVDSLIISILSVSPNGPPVLQGIEVWGQPSLECSPSQRGNIIKLWTQKCIKKEVTTERHQNISVLSSKISEQTNEKSAVTETSEYPIPDEFLDPLTWEMMTQPILLPSGNSIDYRSLEMFLANEAVWGRAASDPFTGVSFRQDYKPEPNVFLKARIDRYFLLGKDLPSASFGGRGHTLTCNDHLVPRLKRSNVKELASSIIPKTVLTAQLLHLPPLAATASVLDLITSEIASPPQPEKTSIRLSAAKVEEPQATNNNGNRHSLIRCLSLAMSSTAKNQESQKIQLKKRKVGNAAPVDGFSPMTTLPPIPSPHCEEKYSLNEMSLNNILCNYCGGKVGPFYSMKCSHNVCHNCLLLQKDEISSLTPITCKLCGQYNYSYNIVRIHPESAFAL